ncbi:MAG: PVC-type heme-binding CxxCH protein [Verrucomicrobiales bacterium]
MSKFSRCFLTFVLACGCGQAALDPGDAYQPRDTQQAGQAPPSPEEAVKALELPEGFRATLFAGEPDVRQPIDMKIDDRGRIWVCEAYSYQEWKKRGEDRIVILSDKDGDGVADERKVFHTGFHHLSSVEIGFGGVWVLDSPHLLFIADKDANDVPDGEPEVLVEGWTIEGGHNVVNGLAWGLDGWLYGRHGITTPSLVGKPGTRPEERTFIEPGIWRYHPLGRQFEVVFRGMTNPWGFDWDAEGEMFLSGNVNGHLWHGIPGALYERMFGAGSRPHDYERIKMIAERTHYPSSGDWKQDWLRADKGRDATNELGGGHSHCGLMIYQGDNWPERYRGELFMCNTHGRRVNWEKVEPKASSFIGRHMGDIVVSNNPWFRGVSLVYGPDGAVFLSDWCDHGECHDDDGAHRSSGRIYKIVYGLGHSQKTNPNLGKRSDRDLAELHHEKNEWWVRHARRLLQERATTGEAMLDESAISRLRELLDAPEPAARLRALWTLQACALATPNELMKASHSPYGPLRAWAARFMCEDYDLLEVEKTRLLKMAEEEPEPRVRLHLAALVQRVPPGLRWRLGEALMKRSEDIADNTLQLELWYGLEPLVAADWDHAAGALPSCAFPKLRRFMTRRIAAEIDDPEARDALGRLLAESTKPGGIPEDIVLGAQAGLRGRTNLPAPQGWPETAAQLLSNPTAIVRDAALDLSVAFGDAATIERLRADVHNAALPNHHRAAALEGLVRARVEDLPKLLVDALHIPALRLAALRGLGIASAPSSANLIIDSYATFSLEEKQAALDAMCSRPALARALLEAIAVGNIPRKDLTGTHARLVARLEGGGLKALLTKVWGSIQSSDAAREAKIIRYKELLSPGASAEADISRGKTIFTRVCATCHVLFGEGGRLGPDLTGSGRKDLDYLVRHVVDPSAAVPRDYQMTIVTLKDGHVLAGVVSREDEKTLSLQSVVELRVLERSEIAQVETQPYSWMPEGLLDALNEQEVRDLAAYVQSDGK